MGFHQESCWPYEVMGRTPDENSIVVLSTIIYKGDKPFKALYGIYQVVWFHEYLTEAWVESWFVFYWYNNLIQ